VEQRQYFARVTAGLEQVAWQDIVRRLDVQLDGFGHRRVDFRYGGPPAPLLDLRCVDDVYVFVARLAGLDHTRASLARLTGKLAQADFGPALAAVGVARALPDRPSYRVTASHLGRRNYSRYDVEGAVEAALAGRLPWKFVPNDPEEDEPDLDVRVLLEDDWALVGLRLGATPLHRRSYKIASGPGSLKAPVAYCLCLLAGLASGDVALDPACGAGTILAEAAALAIDGVIVGGDLDPAALALARTNLEALGLAPRVVADPPRDLEAAVRGALEATPAKAGATAVERPIVLLYQGDAAELPLPARTVRAVVSNLPWGQQVAVESDIAALYSGVLRSIARALAPGARAVLLTDHADGMSVALAACPELRLDSSLQISLFGRHPTIFVLDMLSVTHP